MIYCSNCGQPFPDDNKFCVHCGTARPSLPVQKSDQAESARPAVVETPKTVVVTTAVTNTSSSAPQTTATEKNNFIGNPGFWGAVMVMIGFFLPFYKTVLGEYSLSAMATGGDNTAGRILLLLLPASAFVMIFQAFSQALHPMILNIARILPVLLMVFALGAIMREDETGRSLGGFFEIAQIGAYLTFLGALIMLFFKQKPWTKNKV